MGEDQIVLPLAEVFTAAGVTAWAAAIVGLVQFGKRFLPFIPEHGRGVLALVAVLAGIVVALAAWDIGVSLSPQAIVVLALTWSALGSAAIGLYEAGLKAIAVATGSTDTTGPDERGP